MQNKFEEEGIMGNIDHSDIEMNVTVFIINRNKKLQFFENFLVTNSQMKKIKRKRQNRYNNKDYYINKCINKENDTEKSLLNINNDPGRIENICENILSTVQLDLYLKSLSQEKLTEIFTESKYGLEIDTI